MAYIAQIKKDLGRRILYNLKKLCFHWLIIDEAGKCLLHFPRFFIYIKFPLKILPWNLCSFCFLVLVQLCGAWNSQILVMIIWCFALDIPVWWWLQEVKNQRKLQKEQMLYQDSVSWTAKELNLVMKRWFKMIIKIAWSVFGL